MTNDETKAALYRRRLKSRNFAIALVLLGLALLFFTVTIVRIQQSSEKRGEAPLVINR